MDLVNLLQPDILKAAVAAVAPALVQEELVLAMELTDLLLQEVVGELMHMTMVVLVVVLVLLVLLVTAVI